LVDLKLGTQWIGNLGTEQMMQVHLGLYLLLL